MSFLLKFPVRTFEKLLKPVKRNYSDNVHPGYRHIKQRNYSDNVHPGYRRIKHTQELFQHDDCLPVYLKRGLRDRLLYLFTVCFAGVCLLMDLKLFYDLANPPKPQTKPSEDEEEKEHLSKKEHESKKGKKDDHKKEDKKGIK